MSMEMLKPTLGLWAGSVQAGESKTIPSVREDIEDFKTSARSQKPIGMIL